VFYTDHGADFTSRHLEQVAADCKMRLVFSTAGQPRGRGKIERFFNTINQLCLAELPGYAPKGTTDRAAQARLTLPELDARLGRFIIGVYHLQPHSETGQPPPQRWDANGFLPRLPDSLEQLDLLLLTVAKPRKVHPTASTSKGCAISTRSWRPTSASLSSSATTPATSLRSGSSTRTGSCAERCALSLPA
jgi:putative transposase